MEDKKSASTETSPTVADASTETKPPMAENGANNAEEVTSTTPREPTKHSLRFETWKKLRQNKLGLRATTIFNRIPTFVNSEAAAALLTETDEFKNSKKISVNIARVLNPMKLQVLIHNKDLYLPATRDSQALYLHVDVPEEATPEEKEAILQDFQKHRSGINFDNKVEFDLVVIGAVVVSHDGYYIGRGGGFVDQDIGLLTAAGSITPKTKIAVIVHDFQVVESLPTNLFQKYDVPVDLIVTPTQVIRIEKPLPRPTGIYWDILSERRLKLVYGLQALKEKEEKEGKVIVLKEENTDIEQRLSNYRPRRQPMRRRFQRRFQRRRAQSQTDTEQQGDNNQQQQKRPFRRPRRFNPRRRRQTKSEGDQSAPEGKSQERQESQSNGRRKRQRKSRITRDFCIKLSNLGRSLRVTDLKQELRKRECKPLYITWKGQFGKCLLHFGNRSGVPSSDDDIEKVLKALSNMQITVPTGGGNNNNVDNGQGDGVKPVKTKTINVNVELLKFKDQAQTNGDAAVPAAEDASTTRIESVDTTTV